MSFQEGDTEQGHQRQKKLQNTVLITGGSSGIGLALAQRFQRAGDIVIICGRDEEKLNKAKADNPQLHTRQADVSQSADRLELFRGVISEFPDLNIVINNAGIQNYTALIRHQDEVDGSQHGGDLQELSSAAQEIAINLEALIQLSVLFLNFFLKRQRSPSAPLSERVSAVINVSSGLAFVPFIQTPVYSATKAAVHSFTLSLRGQLQQYYKEHREKQGDEEANSVRIVELIPPAVRTMLGGREVTHGVPLDEYTDAAFADLQKSLSPSSALGVEEDITEITYGFSSKASLASREETNAIFKQLNQL